MAYDANHPDSILCICCNEFNPQFTFLIKLSDGVIPGRYQAFEDFHSSFGWVYRNYPKKQFQIVPFSMDKEGGVKSYLMVEQVKVDETP